MPFLCQASSKVTQPSVGMDIRLLIPAPSLLVVSEVLQVETRGRRVVGGRASLGPWAREGGAGPRLRPAFPALQVAALKEVKSESSLLYRNHSHHTGHFSFLNI